ncbi:branched-chain amino acid ABC transporter permease [Rectinema subterraneum]|uniref:branched-chain amino acid ABC transporter permease n=1 Tax=Rectinema subterraneum TaxID=2653714 RepID=UPI00131C8734|nr:branched-chain amino acid ABC transporter permease [Rectinema subterraneum]
MNVRKLPRFLIAVVLFYIVVEVLYRTEILNGYLLHIINLSLIYVILATSLNLINGITGQFSLGHMGFAGVGAYVSGSLTTLILKLSVTNPASMLPFLLSIIAGGVVAAFVGFLIGFPSLRLKGDYLAIVTLGFGEIIRTIFNNIDAVGGPRGLLGIPKFSNFTVILVAAFLTVVIIRNLIESSHGRAMLSIRENELAAELVCVNTTRYKVMASTFGAFFAGIAGGLLAHLIQLAHPTQFGFIKSVEVLIMIYAGGVGSLTGSILAAFGLTFLSEGLRLGIRALADATGLPIGGEWRMVVYALLLIFIMLFRNEGLMGMRESRIIKNVEVD